MTLYYRDEFVEIHHGDSQSIACEVLSRATVLITDPVWPGGMESLAGSEDPEGLFQRVAARLDVHRVAVHLGSHTDPRRILAHIALPFFRVVSLEYAYPSYRGRLLIDRDIAYLFGRPPTARAGRWVVPARCLDRNHNGNGRESSHPCPRNLTHVQFLVNWWTDPDDVVLDPFCGSGTSLRAAKDLGRRAIGVEIEERYCEMAAKRMEQGVLEIEGGRWRW